MINLKPTKVGGMIGVSRVQQGSRKLFGSDVETNDAILLTIKRAEKCRELNRTWVHGTEKITEVLLTPYQFAEMITLMNYGDGVPCTIKFTQNDGWIDFKPEEDKFKLILDERKESLNERFKELDDVIKKLSSLVETNKMPKTIGREILDALSRLNGWIDGEGRNFINNQAKLEIEKMVVEAKQNIQSYIDYKVTQTGLNTIKEFSQNLVSDLDKGNEK